MNRKAIWAVAIKDMKAIRNSVQVWLPMIIIPIVFCIVLPAALILSIRYWGVSGIDDMDSVLQILDKLPAGSLRDTMMTFETAEEKVMFFALNYMFAPFFLLIPLMTSSVITANSFAVEKERRTLESLLFSPIEISSLFVGKILSALIPSIGLTVVCAALYGLVVDVLAYPVFGKLIFPSTNWIVLILWAVPALSLFAIFFNVVVSARVKGFQEAYQLGGLVILPALALVFSQIAGVLLVSSGLLFAIGAGFFVLDMLFMSRVGRYFDRNSLFESQVSR